MSRKWALRFLMTTGRCLICSRCRQTSQRRRTLLAQLDAWRGICEHDATSSKVDFGHFDEFAQGFERGDALVPVDAFRSLPSRCPASNVGTTGKSKKNRCN